MVNFWRKQGRFYKNFLKIKTDHKKLNILEDKNNEN